MYNCRDCLGETKRNYLEEKVKNPIIFPSARVLRALQRRETERNILVLLHFLSQRGITVINAEHGHGSE